MRPLPLLALLLTLAGPAQAGPKHVLAEIARYGLHAITAGSSVEFDRQTDLCRMHVDLARCQGGYGCLTCRQSLNGGIAAGAILLDEFARSRHLKWESVFGELAVTTYNGITAYQQSQIQGRSDERLDKTNHGPSLSRQVPLVQSSIYAERSSAMARTLQVPSMWNGVVSH